MMSRTQLSLEPEVLRRAKTRARRLGISLAEYFRRLVARDLDEPTLVAEPSTIFNLGTSGGSDVATEKDAMLGAALTRPRKRSR